MPAKPKRGTVPSLDGLWFRQTYYVSQQEISFPHNFPHSIRTLWTLGNTHHYYVCAIPHISAHPHIAPFYSQGETPYVGSKDTKQKNTTHIRRDANPCARACVMCGRAEMCGNQEIRTIPTFARFFFRAALCGSCAETLFRLHVCARNAISCAQGAENAFPAFSERMTQAGTLYSRLVPACLLFIDRDGKMEMRMQVMRYVHVRETNHGDFQELEDLYQATRKDTPDKRATREAKDKDARDASKKRLPCWYLGGTMNGPCCADNARPAGILQIDIDDTDRPQELKNRLAGIDCVAFAAVSASGRGVYALMRVPVGIQRDPDAQKGILDLLDAALLYDRRGDEHIDYACVDLARRRFESFDPEPLYRPDAPEYDPDFRAMCKRAFDASGIASIARNMCGEATPGGASTAVALAALAIRARGQVKGRVFNAAYYPTRFQGVIIGDSGTGKSSRIKDPLVELAVHLGAEIIQPESHRALELAIVESCTQKSCDIGADGKPDKNRPIWTQIDDYRPVLAVYDEAGAEQEARGKVDYKRKMESVRRQAFNAAFIASKSINTPLPTFPLRCSYTDIRISTPKAWALAMHGVDSTAGDARRVLEFWLDSREAPSGARIQSAANMLYRAKSTPSLPCLDEVQSMMELLPGGELKLDGLDSSSSFDKVRGFLASGESMDFETIVCNVATADAYARGCTDAIPRESILAAWAVYFGVLENRRRLADADDAAPDTPESRITGFILDYIGARKGARKSQVVRMLKDKGPSYVSSLDWLIKCGRVIQETGKDGKSTTVRRATDAEMEAFEANAEAQRRDKIFAEARANREKVARNAQPGDCDEFALMLRAEYANADDDGKAAKLDAYLREHEKEPGHELCPGQRDASLRSLATKLHNAGLDDEFAEAWFCGVCKSLGDEFVREQTKRRLWRTAPDKSGCARKDTPVRP